jgi:hypothetical protein
MCTVSWTRRPGGYHLLCNRDEKRTRRPGLPPRIAETGGVRYIAPTDADHRGTWIAVNEFGIGACLLNGTGEADRDPALQSRGMVIRELIRARSIDDCAFLLRHVCLKPFAPFTLVLLEPGEPALVAEWGNAELAIDAAGDERMPLTSSSYDADGVRRSRLWEFAARAASAGSVDANLLYWFHASHAPSAGAYSPCMHRDDAESVSFSWVVVSRNEVRFLYSPAPPCRCAPGEQRIIARAA